MPRKSLKAGGAEVLETLEAALKWTLKFDLACVNYIQTLLWSWSGFLEYHKECMDSQFPTQIQNLQTVT